MLADQIADRLKRAGDESAGAFQLAADIVQLCAMEAEGLSECVGDVYQIIAATLFDTVARLQKAEDDRRPFGG